MSTIIELGERAPQWLRDASTYNADVEIQNGLVIWKRGTWVGGVWESGIWEGGSWHDGVWLDGTWKDGSWHDGVWKGGVWEGGTWLDGTWKDGAWQSGYWQGGAWQGGIWQGGVWQDGVWKGRKWRGLEQAQRHAANAGIAIPVIERLDAQILAAIEAGGNLDMQTWHVCATTHCRAGWAITLAGEVGAKLERLLGPATAGGLIYEASTGEVPNFFADNWTAMEDIRKCATGQNKETQ